MTEKLKLSALIHTEFRTSEAAAKKNDVLMKKLGTGHRYGPARLALAVSLADKKQPEPLSDTKGNGIRGQALFGDDDAPAWIALVTQHAKRELNKQEFSTAVAEHWSRGIDELLKRWQGAEGNLERFITDLAEGSGVPVAGSSTPATAPKVSGRVPSPGPISLHIGELAAGTKKGQPMNWAINSPGHPPHIAVMGAPNTGKTRLALNFAESLRAQSGCATFVFDMGKGDIAGDAQFCKSIGAEVIDCPKNPIPLDILHVTDKGDNNTIQNTAARFCDSVKFVMQSAKGDVQMNRLRQITAEVLEQPDGASISSLRDAYLSGENAKPDSVSAALDSLCDFNLFAPDNTPAEFFSRSWIFDLHSAADKIQRFSAMMILDALNRHFTALGDAPTDSGNNRQMTALLVIDEAHKLLGYNHPALNDIIRLSRSRGGAAILISQSPNDYVKEERDFLANIGLMVSYQTNADKNSVRKVLGGNYAVEKLTKGVCAVRFPGQPVQEVKVWE